MSAHIAIGDAFNLMTNDMRGKLGNYMTSLEYRYGDPQTYAVQREEMAAELASVVHSEVKTREQTLSAAYGKNREGIRSAHKARMGRQARDKPPRSTDPSQTAPLLARANPQPSTE